MERKDRKGSAGTKDADVEMVDVSVSLPPGHIFHTERDLQ